MSQEGRTMLISTHDVDFAYRWADRAVVFSNGQIIADDTPLNIFKREDILNQASLKHPTMFDIYRIMQENDMIPAGMAEYPRNIYEFQTLVGKIS